jgi:hypothetical protein
MILFAAQLNAYKISFCSCGRSVFVVLFNAQAWLLVLRDTYCAWDIKPTAIKLSEAEMASILQSVLTWMN